MALRRHRGNCSESRLSSFLNDRLSEHETGQLADHLDHCDACRQTLERLAAGSRLCAELRELAAELGPVPRDRTPIDRDGRAKPVRDAKAR